MTQEKWRKLEPREAAIKRAKVFLEDLQQGPRLRKFSKLLVQRVRKWYLFSEDPEDELQDRQRSGQIFRAAKKRNQKMSRLFLRFVN